MTRHERRHAKERRGRRILLWIACWFLLAQIACSLVLDYFWVRVRNPMQAERYARLKARARPPEILFLGSSRFGGDINCEVMDAELRAQLGDRAPRTFNAWLGKGDPTAFERVFTELSQEGYRPKLIVLEVDPAALAGRDNWLYYHAMNLLDWTDVPEAGPALCRNGRILFLVRGRLLPLYLHNDQLRRELVSVVKSQFETPREKVTIDPPIPPPVSADPQPPVQSPEAKQWIQDGYADFSRQLRNYHLQGVTTRRLERLLAQCKEAGVPVLLVGVPVSSPQRRACTPEVNAVFLDYLASLEQRSGCSFTDWRERVPDTYFGDGHHVYPEGGVYFSRRFAAEELVPRWRTNAFAQQ
ncbi:MAG: hypothetical protein HYX68_04300 [Planctomycetes bacterium]|nr:hypothetical protein [Planctomycetota bacterium]